MTATATLERPVISQQAPATPSMTNALQADTSRLDADKKRQQKQQLMRRAKVACSHFLTKRGYKVLERDWKCKAGTSDIIARDDYGETIVFAEVKANLDKFPPDTITPKRRERLEAIALSYLTEHEVSDVAVRFDILSLVAVGKDCALIRHHVNALGEA